MSDVDLAELANTAVMDLEALKWRKMGASSRMQKPDVVEDVTALTVRECLSPPALRACPPSKGTIPPQIVAIQRAHDSMGPRSGHVTFFWKYPLS